jgi:hypothetical protein
MEQGLLFDGVDVDGDGFPIHDEVKRSIDVAAHAALARLAWLDSAKMLAGLALHGVARERLGEIGFFAHWPPFPLALKFASDFRPVQFRRSKALRNEDGILQGMRMESSKV